MVIYICRRLMTLKHNIQKKQMKVYYNRLTNIQVNRLVKWSDVLVQIQIWLELIIGRHLCCTLSVKCNNCCFHFLNDADLSSIWTSQTARLLKTCLTLGFYTARARITFSKCVRNTTDIDTRRLLYLTLHREHNGTLV